MPGMTIVAKALVRAARAIMKIKGIKGIIGMSPEGVKKATGIIAKSGKRKAIQTLIARSPSQIRLQTIKELFEKSSLSQEALRKR